MPEPTSLHPDCRQNEARGLEHLYEKARAIRAQLSPEARFNLDRQLDAWQVGGPPPIGVRVAWEPDYCIRPVPIREFISDPQYLGPNLGKSIYPRIVDDLEELFDGDYQEVVLCGAQRWGKSVMAEVGMIYEIYRVSCLRNPATAFGALPGTRLAFVNASLTLAHAERVIFGGLLRLLQQSPYFSTCFPYDRNVTKEIRFLRKNVICYPVAANEQAFMGIDIFSAAIDEANFMQIVEKSKQANPAEGGRYDQIEAIYNRLLVRLKGSWNHRNGGIPGHMWLISSARYPDDFTERKEREALENRSIFVRHYALWDTKPGLSRVTFPVEAGDKTRRTRVLDDDESKWPADVHRDHVIRVPEDYRMDFKRNPEKCLRDLAGISTLSITPFVPMREAIRGMFERGEAEGMKPTFSELEVTLQSPLPETERLLKENLHWIDRQKTDVYGRPVFKDVMANVPDMERVLFPALYYAHVDLSKNRCGTGVVVGHAVCDQRVARTDPASLNVVYENMPVIRVDLALRVVAPPDGEIDIPRVRALFYQLRDLGMQFGLITFDQFGSQESIKALKDNGFPADEYSLEKELTPWEEMKQALYDGRLLCFEFPHLEMEIAQLELVKGKIEKPAFAGASKDVADCLAAVVHHVEEGWRNAMGAQGMFQIGLVAGREPEQSLDKPQVATRVVRGQPANPVDQNQLLFGDLSRLG